PACSGPLRRASSASSRLRTVISRRFARSARIDTWRVSVQTPPRPPWSSGSGPAHRRWRDRSARLRDRHQEPSSNAGTRHRPGRWPASGDAGYPPVHEAPAGQRATARPAQEGFRLTRHPRFPHDLARIIHDADARLLDRHIESSKIVHAALLLLMLEAADADLVSLSA